MSDTTPSVPGDLVTLVADPAEKESWTLTLIKVGGPVLAGFLTLVSSIIAMFLTDRMPEWMAALPVLAGLDASIIAAAWSGPILKRGQLLGSVSAAVMKEESNGQANPGPNP